MKRGPGRPGGRNSKPRGGGRPGRQDLTDTVDRLVADTGIPRPWAWQVARGQATLNEVITRLAQADRVERLISRHGLDRSIATQVASGDLDLDQVLFKQRMKAHLDEHRSRATFDRALATGSPLTLHLHGLRSLTGRITAVDPYEVVVEGPAGPERVHKLQVKLAHDPKARVKIRAAASGRVVAEPVPRPQDRYPCSDRRLFTALDNGQDSRAVTLEGDQVEGQVAWISRWEVALRQKGGAEVVVFRHALNHFEEA